NNKDLMKEAMLHLVENGVDKELVDEAEKAVARRGWARDELGKQLKLIEKLEEEAQSHLAELRKGDGESAQAQAVTIRLPREADTKEYARHVASNSSPVHKAYRFDPQVIHELPPSLQSRLKAQSEDAYKEANQIIFVMEVKCSAMKALASQARTLAWAAR